MAKITKYYSQSENEDKDSVLFLLERKNRLHTLLFTLTYQCNLNCSMCFAKDINKKTLDFSTIKTILDEGANEGLLHVMFSGGEAMLRKDFLEIYRYAVSKGLLVTVMTNLTLLDEKILACFKDFPPEVIQVSIYGFSRKTYEAVTQVEGSFDRFMANLRRLKKTKIRIRYALTCTRANEKDFSKFVNMPVRPWEYKIFDAVLRGRRDLNFDKINIIKKDRLAPEKVGRLRYEFAPEKLTFPIPEISDTDKKTLFGRCQNMSTLFIDPSGTCSLCVEAALPSHRITYTSGKLRKIYEELFREVKSTPLPKDKEIKCIRCNRYAYCSWCPQYSLLEGNLEPDAYYCRMMDAFCEKGENRNERKKEKKEISASAFRGSEGSKH